MNLVVLSQRFPDGEVLASARSTDTASSGAKKTLSVTLSFDSIPRGDPIYHQAFLVQRGVDISAADPSTGVFVNETDPFEVTPTSGKLQKLDSSTIPELASISSDSGRYHERKDVEGGIFLTYEGRTGGKSWSVRFYVFKAAYVEARRRDHGRSRPEFVAYEMSNGFSKALAGILSDSADQYGFYGQDVVEFVIDFVQYLPYVPDDVSRGFDDYTLYGIETIAEGGGDCEDTSILLAAVLQSQPINYDMILIQPPHHMAAGIKGTNLGGYYWIVDGNEYYYIETTGTGWGIGDLPDEYKNTDAFTYQV